MKKIIVIALAIILAAGLLLAGCTPEAQKKIKDALDNATTELETGETYSWTPSFYTTDGEGNQTAITYTADDVTYESSAPASVSVGSSGLITAVAPSGAIVTAYYHKGQDDAASASIIITVYSPSYRVSVGSSTSWNALDQIIASAGESSTVDFETGTLSYSQGTGKGSVSLSESSRGVVTITGSGIGFVTVTASYSGGGSASVSASVVVKVS